MFDYKQRPATDKYRENYDRIFSRIKKEKDGGYFIDCHCEDARYMCHECELIWHDHEIDSDNCPICGNELEHMEEEFGTIQESYFRLSTQAK